MFKRLIVVAIALILVLSLWVSAAEEYSLKLGEGFYTLEDADKLTDIFGVTDTELSKFCTDNNVSYLAVNADRSQEIRLQILETDFSKTVGNFSKYTDNELYTLSLDIIGLSGVTGKIVENNGNKFIKTELSLGESSKDYKVLQYTTITDGKYYILGFYTNSGEFSPFADDIFESFKIYGEAEETIALFEIVIPICIVLLAAIIVISAFYTIKFAIKAKEDKSQF